MSTELLPCPFCGTAAKWFKAGSFAGIECANETDCPGNAQTETFAPEHKDSAIAMWNRRAPPVSTPSDAEDAAN
jgi:hypothetical protein